MNKKLILGLGATALLTSSLFAYQGGMGQEHHNMMKKQYTTGHHKMMNQNMQNSNMQSSKMMRTIMMLNLDTKQKKQIQNMMIKNRKNMPNPHDAFTENSFDKAKYIKLAKQKSDKIQKGANMMEKVYKILTPAQKKDLKTILDMKNIKQKRMMSQN